MVVGDSVVVLVVTLYLHCYHGAWSMYISLCVNYADL